MKKTIALLWLLVTLSPLAWLVFFIGFMSDPGPQTYAAADAQFKMVFRFQFIVIFLTWGLVASYVVYLFRTKHVPMEKRALWAVVLFLGNMIAMPIFWYVYVWRPMQAHEPGNATGP